MINILAKILILMEEMIYLPCRIISIGMYFNRLLLGKNIPFVRSFLTSLGSLSTYLPYLLLAKASCKVFKLAYFSRKIVKLTFSDDVFVHFIARIYIGTPE